MIARESRNVVVGVALGFEISRSVMGFGTWDLGFRGALLGFGTWDLGFRVALGFGISRVTTWMNVEGKASCDDRI